ncbi:hypothetical protein R6Q59_017562 [Mikania micrantha]
MIDEKSDEFRVLGVVKIRLSGGIASDLVFVESVNRLKWFTSYGKVSVSSGWDGWVVIFG